MKTETPTKGLDHKLGTWLLGLLAGVITTYIGAVVSGLSPQPEETLCFLKEAPFVHPVLDQRIPGVLVTSFEGPNGAGISAYMADRIQSRTGIPTLHSCRTVPLIRRGLSEDQSDKNVRETAEELALSRGADIVVMGNALSDHEIQLAVIYLEPNQKSSIVYKRTVSKSDLENPQNRAFDDLAERLVYTAYKDWARSIEHWARMKSAHDYKEEDYVIFEDLMGLLNFDFGRSARRFNRDLEVIYPMSIYGALVYANSTNSCRVAMIARDLAFDYFGKVYMPVISKSEDEKRQIREASNLLGGAKLKSYLNCTKEMYDALNYSRLLGNGQMSRKRDLEGVHHFVDSSIFKDNPKPDCIDVHIDLPKYRYDDSDEVGLKVAPWAYPSSVNPEIKRIIRFDLASVLYEILIEKPDDSIGQDFKQGMIKDLLIYSLSELEASGYTLGIKTQKGDALYPRRLENTPEWSLLASLGVEPDHDLLTKASQKERCRKYSPRSTKY